MKYLKISKIYAAWFIGFCIFHLAATAQSAQTPQNREVIFLAGKKSHGYGAHEHKAGSMLLARCLNKSGLGIEASVVTEGAWPDRAEDEAAPDAIVMYCDGFKRHMAKVHLPSAHRSRQPFARTLQES